MSQWILVMICTALGSGSAQAASGEGVWLQGAFASGATAAWLLGVAVGAFLAAAAVLWWWLGRRRASAKLVGGLFTAGSTTTVPMVKPSVYSPENVGNDASARPWERSSMAFQVPQAPSPSVARSALMTGAGWGIPEGFDADGFLRTAKANFISLQAAWDRSDVASLRAMMTDGMLFEIQSQLLERESHTGGSTNTTEVVMVQAHLLGIEEQPESYTASVEFSGMIREVTSAGPNPFREVWNMTRLKTGSNGWLVAAVQALQ